MGRPCRADTVLEQSSALGREVSTLESVIESAEPNPESISVFRRAELELQMATETLLSARHLLAERLRASDQLRLQLRMGRG